MTDRKPLMPEMYTDVERRPATFGKSYGERSYNNSPVVVTELDLPQRAPAAWATYVASITTPAASAAIASLMLHYLSPECRYPLCMTEGACEWQRRQIDALQR